MPLTVKPYNYTNGQTIDANQLDQNLDTLYNLVNGALDTVNIAANGISDPTKIAAETVTQSKTKGVIYSQDLFGQSWVVSGGVVTASGSPANQVTVTTLVANILQADGSYRHVSVSGTTYVTAIINATYYLELQPDGTMNWSQTHSLQSGYMPIATVTSDGSGNILLITDNRITDPKLKGSLNNTIYSLEREVANLKAASSIANRVDGASTIIFDLNDGLNGGSDGKIDLSSTNATGAITATASPITVPVTGGTTGFAVGQEVTIFTDAFLERRPITGMVAGTSVTFAAMTNSYAAKARICRSSVIQDTVNKLLKFGGWSYQTTYTNTAVSVVASAYDTSGNGGRKIVYLSNGWWVIAAVNGTSQIVFDVSKDNGATWSQLCFITISAAPAGVAIANNGNIVSVLTTTAAGTSASFYKFDASTVTNIAQSATSSPLSGQSSFGSGASLAIAPNGALTSTACSKNATYPNSFNIISQKSTDGGVTWTKQDGTAGVDQLTVNNTAGIDETNPCVVIRSNNNPVILIQQASGTTNYVIIVAVYSGTWTNYSVYSGGTYSQSNPCASVAPSGRIWCTWGGFDSTDTGQVNIRISYSDDGGATWSAMQKLTSGNTYSQNGPSVSIDKNNNVYVLWYGVDSAISTSWYQIRRVIWNGTSWSSITTLTSNTTADARNQGSIDNNTLDFNSLTPPMIYRDNQATAVKFSGTYIAGTSTPVLVEDVRYNINPPSNVSSAVAWVDHDADANYSVAGAVSFQAGGGNESFANMTKSTAAIDGTHNEDQLTGSGTSAAKATLRLTLTRNSTALVKNISSVMGAVGA